MAEALPQDVVEALDRRLASVLPGDALFAVGGRVRDELRSAYDGTPRPATDLDYVVVGLSLADLVRRIEAIGTADVVGASFAVVKATIDGVTLDVALPRRERSTGVGHRAFAVESGPSVPLVDDLARRDFRMNMMARGLPDGPLVDPYDGAGDVRERRISIIANEAFVEDPLRMLRACQFAARFAFDVDAATFRAMTAAASLVESVSPERVRDELVKLLGAPKPSIGFEVMRRTGLLAHVLPELAAGVGIEQNVFHAYDVYGHTLATTDATDAGDLTLRLAGLLHDVGKPETKDGPHFYGHDLAGERLANELLGRLRFSADTVSTVARLVRNHMYAIDPVQTDASIRRFVVRVGEANVTRQFALRSADIAGSGLAPRAAAENAAFEARVAAAIAARPPMHARDLAVDGADVSRAAVARGRLPSGSRGGPIVGAVLRDLLDTVIEDPAANDRESLLDRVDRLVCEWQSDSAESAG